MPRLLEHRREEAALAYAKTPEAQAQLASTKPAPLKADEVVAQARDEGLTRESASGYKGVRIDKGGGTRCTYERRG